MARAADTVRRAWARLAPLPGGTRLFSILIGRLIPYTGTIRGHVLALEPGYARVALRDRRGVRNHLGSIHAIALANLGEVTSGLALTMALEPDVDGILTGLSVAYVKKARGRLIAECRTHAPALTADATHTVEAVIRDAAGDVVATVTAEWRLRRARR